MSEDDCNVQACFEDVDCLVSVRRLADIKLRFNHFYSAYSDQKVILNDKDNGSFHGCLLHSNPDLCCRDKRWRAAWFPSSMKVCSGLRPVMGWSGRAPAPPAREAGKGAPKTRSTPCLRHPIPRSP